LKASFIDFGKSICAGSDWGGVAYIRGRVLIKEIRYFMNKGIEKYFIQRKMVAVVIPFVAGVYPVVAVFP